MHYNSEHTRQFLRALMPAGTCLEMMIFRSRFGRGGHVEPSDFATTLAGWFDRPDSFAVDAARLRGVSGFVIPNPVDPAFLASSDNKLRKVGKEEACGDKNVTILRWLYLDFDADKPGKEMSSTAEELAETVAKRDRVFLEFPEFSDHSMWGCSGNGSWALVRLPDYPNDDEHESVIRRTVDFFAAEFGGDPHTKNPARLMPLIGTLKCKGSSRPDRPWRLATLDSPPTESTGFDLISWAARNLTEPAPSAPQGAPGGSPKPAAHYGGRLSKYAADALEDEASKVAGAAPHDANNALNLAAVNLGELVAAGALCRAEVEQVLIAAARMRGKDDPEIHSTLRSGLDFGMSQPRSLSHVGNGGKPPGKPPRDGGGTPGPGPEDARNEGKEDNPHELARIFRGNKFSHPEGFKLRFWNGQFHAWIRGAYRPIPDGDIRAQVTETVAEEFDHLWLKQLAAHGMGGDDKKPPRPIPVTMGAVSNVLQALESISLLSHSDHPENPCWIDGENSWPVDECVPMRNAIVHLPSLAAGLPCTRKPTPRMFAPYVLNYDFSPDVGPPARWLAFLKSVFPTDQQSIDTLQEWMGLQLVPDLRYEKIMAFIGPPRAGKGTIAEVIAALVGPENCAGPTLSSLGERFELGSLVGKLSAIIDDARLSSKSDHAVITERLLSISGGGRLTIDRKYKEPWIGKLPCRITLISNELPRLADASSALPSRLIVLRFTESFLKREDLSLKADLKKELSGIFLWAVEGWKRLKERGRLIQPESGDEDYQSMVEISSPITTFIAECLDIDDDESAPCQDVFRAWHAWCETNGHKDSGTIAVFSRNLRSVLPRLKTKQKRIGDGKARVFAGIALKAPGEFGDAYATAPGGFVFDDKPPFD